MRRFVAVGLVLALPGAAAAQDAPEAAQPCGATAVLRMDDILSPEREFVRVAQLAGAAPPRSMLLRRGSGETGTRVCVPELGPARWMVEPAGSESDAVAVRLLPVSFQAERRSAFPRDVNNGALWSGVGWSTRTTGGVRLRWRWLSAALAPELLYHENADFETVPRGSAGRDPLGNPYHPEIDWPQRFGTEPLSSIRPGQSYVRAASEHLEAGFSTENVWLGPAQVYPILVSGTAPGFPHLFAGTARPLGTWIGDVEVKAVWGRVSESELFDGNPENDERLFTAFLLGWGPRWIPGLSLGMARVYHEIIPPGGLPLGYQLGAVMDRSIFFASGGNREDGNAIGALYARWAFPESGFEAYLEWAREDTPYDLKDALNEPDWTQAYTVGVQQIAKYDGYWLRWFGELVHLGQSAPVRAGKGEFSYYTHARAVQGHTNRGQILGAAVGPGSDAQVVGLDVYHRRGLAGLWVERTRYDEDTYYTAWARRYGESRHDVEITGGVRQVWALDPFRIEGRLAYSRRYNRSFLRLDDTSAQPLVEPNWTFGLRASWTPRWGRVRAASRVGEAVQPPQDGGGPAGERGVDVPVQVDPPLGHVQP